MVHKLMAAGVCLALAVIAGCSDGDDPSSEPTGIAAVDAAIDAFERQDIDSLVAQIHMSLAPCEPKPSSLSPFPACDGEPEGTLLQAFAVTSCELFHNVSRDEAVWQLRNFITPASRPRQVQVHTVFDTEESELTSAGDFAGSYYAHVQPNYVIVLQAKIPDIPDYLRGRGLVLNDEGVVGFIGGCSSTPASLIRSWQLHSLIIPPPTPTVLPEFLHTGIASVDAAVDAIHRGDSDAFLRQMRLTSLACDASPDASSPFPACDDEPPGTLVAGFPITGCSSLYISREEAESYVENIVIPEFEIVEVHAVYRTRGTYFDRSFFSRAAPQYVIVLKWSSGLGLRGNALLLDADGIVGFHRGCGEDPEEVISFWELTDAIIPPPDER